ncbi:MAG: hypothetical protein K2N25_04270, partial [Muribaculaceae bacterium]|nr:hypothetical protein [Muribaculaceae bacterium]
MIGRMASVRLERCKLVLTDWITANISFLLVNLLRFFDSPDTVNTPGDTIGFLFQSKLCVEQATVPIALVALYWLSGFYNHPFGKSRFNELLNTAIVSAVSTILIHLAFLTNDQMSDISSNLMQILMIFVIFFS